MGVSGASSGGFACGCAGGAGFGRRRPRAGGALLSRAGAIAVGAPSNTSRGMNGMIGIISDCASVRQPSVLEIPCGYPNRSQNKRLGHYITMETRIHRATNL